VRVLAAAVQEAEARRRLGRLGVLGRLRGDRLHRLELVTLPCYRIAYEIDRAGGGPQRALALVDAIIGEVRLLTEDEDLPSATGHGSTANLLPPALRPVEAERRARAEMTEAVVRQELRTGGLGPEDVRVGTIEPIALPYWVQHWSRRGRFDVRVLDALTGERVGLRVRRAIVRGMVTAAQS
jgi:hypothetical protein